ncbi:hypothetical protein O6H91_10G085200 [Diphasiastrum complanatum]|uniref:Uncharacterized protein n=1 Tax=Diphasiastrum complanatum TaxID=34168 RepID=A0ACC2CJ00_DIPCM|nr:hypothetical protein O6H91_10G085200 [Diphasiastrum complanatum]
MRVSSEAKQARLFLLVICIVIAIWVRSKPLTPLPSSDSYQVQEGSNQCRPSRRRSTKRQLACSSSYANFTVEAHQSMRRRYAANNQLLISIKTAPSSHPSMRKRSASYPLLSADVDADHISIAAVVTTLSQNANEQEQIVTYKGELRESIEAFIALNYE